MSFDLFLERYPLNCRSVVFDFLDKLAKVTRKTGVISDSKREKIVSSFGVFDVDVVIDSLNVYLSMDISASKGGNGKNEKYVLGIMKNKQDEKGSEVGCCYGGNKKFVAAGAVCDEGDRLRKLAITVGGGKLECDF